jgi:type IV secretion system protein TrbC
MKLSEPEDAAPRPLACLSKPTRIFPSEECMRTTIRNRRKVTDRRILLAALLSMVCWCAAAHAAGAGMPWETPLNSLLNSLTGPIAKIAGVAAVVITGLGMAFSEGGSGMRKLVTVAFGLTIAFAATTFFLPLFGYAGGAAF